MPEASAEGITQDNSITGGSLSNRKWYAILYKNGRIEVKRYDDEAYWAESKRPEVKEVSRCFFAWNKREARYTALARLG